jgi:hypothetical protein
MALLKASVSAREEQETVTKGSRKQSRARNLAVLAIMRKRAAPAISFPFCSDPGK